MTTKIFYRDIELKVVKTRQCQKRHLKDPSNTDYTMTEWTFDVDCIYNPEATSVKHNYELNTVDQNPGHHPFETDDALQRYLSAPRGKLVVYGLGAGTGPVNQILVMSPISGMECDVMGGPFVEYCGVTKVHGLKTWLVSIRIVTYVNTCLISTLQSAMERKVLLSHRWKQYHDINEDHFATIINEGTAIFRMDALRKMSRHPDQYRGALVQAVPPGFKREQIHVTVNEPGNIVRYRTVDVQQPYNVSSGQPCTRIEALHTWSYSKMSPLSAVVGEIPSIAQNFINYNTGSAQAAAGAVARDPSMVASGYNQQVNSAVGLGNNVLNISTGFVQGTVENVYVRVYGNKQQRRAGFFFIAASITAGRLSTPIVKTVEMVVKQHLTAKVLEMSTTVRAGLENAPQAIAETGFEGIAGLFTGGVANPTPDAVRFLAPRISLPESIGAIITNDPIDALPSIPMRDGRGTWLGSMVYQSLSQNPCDVPRRNPTSNEISTRTVSKDWNNP